MKRITKIIFIVLVAVAFVATGCKKESEYKTVTLGAKIAPGNSKVYIDNYTPKWQPNDQVSVNGNTITVDNNSINGNTATLPNVPESNNGYYAIYPAENATAFSGSAYTVDLPHEQVYTEVDGHQVVKAPMGAKTDGGSLTFHNLCSLLKVTVTAGETLKISGIKVTAGTTNLSGSTSITLSGEATDALPAPATGSKSVTLSFGSSGKTLSAGDHVFYIYLPAFNSQEVSVEVYNIGANDVLGVKKKIFNNISVSANTINTLGTGSLTAASFMTTGALSGLFSVSADKKVRFSMGNLQAVFSTTTAYTWRFAANQYDYIGNTTANTDINKNGKVSTIGTVDLFGWSTGSTTFGINDSQKDNGYSGDFIDWGTNAISNGGNTANQWRTLTTEEWDYLLTQRSGMLYAKCVITNGSSYNGLIIFPDGFTAPSGITIASPNTAAAAFTTNAFTANQWSTLQNAGCIFLPAAGYRFVKEVRVVGVQGHYWSSSSATSATEAWYLNFFYSSNSGAASPVDSYRKHGRSVRLVQDY